MKKVEYHCRNCNKKTKFTIITTGHDIMAKKELCQKCYAKEIVKGNIKPETKIS